MPLPPFIIQPDSQGDDNKYAWSTRVSESLHQFLIDLQADYNMNNKSEVMRTCVLFTRQYLGDVAKQSGSILGKRISATIKSQQVKSEQDRRREMHREILDLLTRAASEPSMPMRMRLEDAAKELAEAWTIPYPPPDLPFEVRDKDAAYVLRKLHKIATDNETNKVRLNELNPRASMFGAEELREILSKLEEANCLSLREERTSGPPTLWIVLPALQPNGVFNY